METSSYIFSLTETIRFRKGFIFLAARLILDGPYVIIIISELQGDEDE